MNYLKIKLIKNNIRAEFSSIDSTILYKDLTGLLPEFREPAPEVILSDPRPVFVKILKTINSLKTI